ncbi:MAG: MBL fold metallo-hydrolase [Acholeplasmatales bacterium]|nr:MBL fold metallo-hydrolase [Acholeplasmatales bacterium]
MRIKVFSSGSDGNSTIVVSNNKKILIDLGITRKQIVENLNKMDIDILDLDAILITHEHTDHIKALPTMLKECQIPIYLSKGTLNSIYDMYKASGKTKLIELIDKRFNEGSIIILSRTNESLFYDSFNIGSVYVDVLPAFHDAAETLGYVIHEGEKKLVYMTDTGYVHDSLWPIINDAEAYILESNHDPEILMASNRPYNLKIRILSDHGHMSNEESMITLANIMGPKTKVVLHAHVSQECNLSQLIELTRKKVFDSFGIDTEGIEFEILHPYPSKEYNV